MYLSKLGESELQPQRFYAVQIHDPGASVKKNHKRSYEVQEQAFLASYDASHYPHPSLSVDVALVTADGLGLARS